jgi:hypothetical protein
VCSYVKGGETLVVGMVALDIVLVVRYWKDMQRMYREVTTVVVLVVLEPRVVLLLLVSRCNK